MDTSGKDEALKATSSELKHYKRRPACIDKDVYDMILKLAGKYKARSFAYIAFDDLVQVGMEAYFKKINEFDKKQNVKITTYFFRRIRGAMLDYIVKQSIHGKTTVRPKLKRKEPLIVPFPSNPDAESLASMKTMQDLEDEIDRVKIYKVFISYLDKYVTEVEKYVLVAYVLRGEYIKDITAMTGISRGKVKRLVENILADFREYLKAELGLDDTMTGKINIRSLSYGTEANQQTIDEISGRV